MYAVLTHLPHLLQSFPSFSSLYYPFHKTSCVLLVTVPCPVIVPFCLCRPLHTLLPGTGGLVQLFIRCSQLKRCHSSTFSSLPEIKFPQCVQIPYFSCICMPQKLKQQHKGSHSCRKHVNPHYRETYLQSVSRAFQVPRDRKNLWCPYGCHKIFFFTVSGSEQSHLLKVSCRHF